MTRNHRSRRARVTLPAAVILLFALIGCDMPGDAGSAVLSPSSIEGTAALSTTADSPKAWDANTLYSRAGIYVSHRGKVWVSRWWITRGQEPGANSWNGWQEVNPSTPSKNPANPDPWDAQTLYNSKGFYVTHNGRVWVSLWWITRGQEPGANTWNGWKPVTPASPPWAHIAAGWKHNLAVSGRGELYAWGNNRRGQLGDGSAENKSTPVKIGDASDWKHTAAGSSFSLAINAEGQLYAWGENNRGQLGDGGRENKSRPSEIASGTVWTDITAGGGHGLALNSGGELYAWGRNREGQLGDGSTVDRLRPTRIGVRNNWTHIAAGVDYSLAINSDGQLYAWGRNKRRAAGRRQHQ